MLQLTARYPDATPLCFLFVRSFVCLFVYLFIYLFFLFFFLRFWECFSNTPTIFSPPFSFWRRLSRSTRCVKFTSRTGASECHSSCHQIRTNLLFNSFFRVKMLCCCGNQLYLKAAGGGTFTGIRTLIPSVLSVRHVCFLVTITTFARGMGS